MDVPIRQVQTMVPLFTHHAIVQVMALSYSLKQLVNFDEYLVREDFLVQNNSSDEFSIAGAVIFGLTMTGATFVVFFTAFIQVPMLQVLLYSVPLPYQSMALGLRQTIVRVLGQTTGPLLFGYVFDQSCLTWLTDCYNRKTCKVYDNRRMGISMAFSGFSTRIISGIACIIVFINWKLESTKAGINLPNSTTTPTDNTAKKEPDGTITASSN